MGDLFHETVEFNQVLEVMLKINKYPQHTFLILTKRPQRMHEYFTDWVPNPFSMKFGDHRNVWLGVTAENQRRANERIPILLDIPAAKRFVSVEPMLDSIDLTRVNVDSSPGHYYNFLQGNRYGRSIIESFKGLDWVICGGESGPGSRPMRYAWPYSLMNQCQEANVPFMFKQWGDWVPFQYIADGKPVINLTPDKSKELLLHDPPENIRRVGKKKAGRLLDGKVWDQKP